jgi:AcrR family transcriptional regulator
LYFRDKEEVLLAVVLRGLTILHEFIHAAFLEIEKENEGLGKIGRAYYKFSIEHPQFLKLIMMYESNNCIYYKTGKPADSAGYYSMECQKQTDATAEVITEAIQRGMDNGSIKTSLPPTQLMLVLWGHVLGIMQIISIRKESFEDAYGIDYETLFDISQQIVEKGIATK